MTADPERLLENNRDWAAGVEHENPGFFQNLAAQQHPQFLWIGCSDSRVPANQIVGLPPGEVFVHRNVANVILHTDLNCLSVVEFAVKVLEVRHIIVCGHYGCGGVRAAMTGQRIGLVDQWLYGVSQLCEANARDLTGLDEEVRLARMCELNVLYQLNSLCRTGILREAWEGGRDLTVHGWIYGVGDGLLHDLGARVDGSTDLRNS